MIHASLSFNIDSNLIQSALPLFAAESVEGLEWSFDTLHERPEIPEWFAELLQSYGDAGRLVGHGVFFSMFSGKWLPEQANWLAELKALCNRFRFDHISEHFGFFTGSDFHKGAPLSVPYSKRTLAIGQDRLLRIADACGCPVGLENLAFATDTHSARIHGEFLEALLEPMNGFLILDLHNLYCQLQNFGLEPAEMLAGFPLARVREIHISGGSWEPSAFRPQPGVRRDTHDDQVPEEVFQLLSETMGQCPNLKFVVLEQMSHALADAESQSRYQADFLRMRDLVHLESAKRASNQALQAFLPPKIHLPTHPLEDETLYSEQILLSNILENSGSFEAAKAAVQASVLASGEWNAAAWDPAMLETARQIAQKWRDGF
ncbi:MAG TPA: DUF692 family protein [Bacteroidia bacterium]|nr:DUF692 family protein [Bacteroidia bacterium]